MKGYIAIFQSAYGWASDGIYISSSMAMQRYPKALKIIEVDLPETGNPVIEKEVIYIKEDHKEIK